MLEGQRLLAEVPVAFYDHTEALTRERLTGFACATLARAARELGLATLPL